MVHGTSERMLCCLDKSANSQLHDTVYFVDFISCTRFTFRLNQFAPNTRYTHGFCDCRTHLRYDLHTMVKWMRMCLENADAYIYVWNKILWVEKKFPSNWYTHPADACMHIAYIASRFHFFTNVDWSAHWKFTNTALFSLAGEESGLLS